MPHGGARAGAGRKASGDGRRNYTLRLSAAEQALLADLEGRLQLKASEVLRRALVELAERQVR